MRILLPLFLLIFIASALHAQHFEFSGRVRASDHEFLPYVTVSLKNTNLSTITDEEGYFRMVKVPAGTYQLVVSHIGYKNFEQTVEVKEKGTTREIILEASATELQEVMVTAEKQTRMQETKPIAVSSVEIKNVLTQNTLITDVVDRLSGVRIRRSSSLGESSDISINGMRGNAVRVYIDGLPMEFMYPNFDISTLPIGNLKRIDVYKGVLPVDVGTDALGGGINLITEQKSYNALKASYSYGSFNTHMSDINVSLANSRNYFINITGAYNYSDNNYGMNALIYEKNKVEHIRRFHDRYRMGFGGISIGTHSKPWGDELRLTLNLSGGDKELQNGARVTNTAFGEVLYKAKNFSGIIKYEKTFLGDKILFSTIANYSEQAMRYVDTTRNVYSWSGKIVGVKTSPGEYSYLDTDNHIQSWVNRSGISVKLAPGHRLLFSNLYARQRMTGIDYTEDNPERDYLRIPQLLNKNIAGAQYEGTFFSRLTLSAALKRFDFVLNGAENMTFQPVRTKDGIWGWNSGAKFDIATDFFVRASYEKGYLIPSFYQFVGNGADILRNTDLLPESSDNFNLGASISRRIGPLLRIATTANGFYRNQDDIIFLGDGVIKRYENADRVRTVGVEGDLAIFFRSDFMLKTNVTFLRKTFTKVKVAESQFLIGTAFPNNPNFYANSELSWQKISAFRKTDKFRAYLFYNYIAPFNHITVGQGNSVKNTPLAYVPVQHRLDAGVSYKLPGQSLTASINVINLFDAELYDNFLVPRAGINFNAKLIYELSNF